MSPSYASTRVLLIRFLFKHKNRELLLFHCYLVSFQVYFWSSYRNRKRSIRTDIDLHKYKGSPSSPSQQLSPSTAVLLPTDQYHDVSQFHDVSSYSYVHIRLHLYRDRSKTRRYPRQHCVDRWTSENHLWWTLWTRTAHSLLLPWLGLHSREQKL